MTGQPSAQDLYVTARTLARAGQPVFPCRSRYIDEKRKDKMPLTTNGWQDASTDPAQIKSWWRRHRDAAVGIPTGVMFDVLDVDIKREADGRVHLPRLTELGLLNGCKRVARTPSGGFHLYFPPNPSMTNKANAKLGLDIRASGGYVLAPGSYIESEGYAGWYEEEDAPVGGNDDPIWWYEIINTLAPADDDTGNPIYLLPSERRASVSALREWVANLQPGERNNGLHWAVCRCIENGIDPHEMAEAAVVNGLTEHETLLTINSAMKRAGLTVNDLQTEAEALFPDSE